MSKTIVFISVPYSQNPKRGEELSLMAGMFIRHIGKTPFSPVFNFQRFADNGNEYDAVIEDCLVMLRRCDEVLCIEEEGCLSHGQNIEFTEALKLNKPIVKVTAKVLIDYAGIAIPGGNYV